MVKNEQLKLLAHVLFWLSWVIPQVQAAPIELSAVEYAGMDAWQKKGPTDESNWEVLTGGKTVEQTVNGRPSFFVTQNDYINVTVMGTIEVDTTSDDDHIGIVVGYQAPDIAPAANQELNYDMILFDWKQADQTINGVLSREGFGLHQLSGNINSSDSNSNYFWHHAGHTDLPTSGSFSLLDSDYAADGWEDQKEYAFRMIHTDTKIKVRINNVLIFEETINVAGGKLGFYNHSQKDVIYGNVRLAPGSDTPAAPVATADVYGTGTNTSKTVDWLEGLVANDYDPNLDLFRINIESSGNYTGSYTSDDQIQVFQTSHGKITLSGNGAFVYTPANNFEGIDSFSYSLTDNWTTVPDGTSSTVQVQIVVNDNLAPTDLTLSDDVIDFQSENDDVLAYLDAVDPNDPDLFEYVIASQSDNILFSVSGNELKLNDDGLIGAIGSTHTVTILVTDANGATYTETFTLTVVDNRPQLTLSQSSLTIDEQASAVVLDASMTVADRNDTQWVGANVTLSDNFVSGDTLAVTSTANVTASFDASTGNLQLVGQASLAEYEAMLESLTFAHTGDNPDQYGSTGDRVLGFLLYDSSGNGELDRYDITVTAVNDLPVIADLDQVSTYIEGAGNVAVESSLGLSDVDNLNFSSAMVSLGSQALSSDELSVNTLGTGITTAFSTNDLGTGNVTLRLTGPARLSDMERVLETLAFDQSSDDPDDKGALPTRTVTIFVTDENGGVTSASTTLNIQSINDAPDLSDWDTTPSYTENSSAITLDAALSLNDVDHGVLNGANITISNNVLTGDLLDVDVGTSGLNATWTYPTLTITGQATLAVFESVLETLTYFSSSDNPDDYGNKTSRELTMTCFDPDGASATASITMTIVAINDAPTCTWTVAETFTEHQGWTTISANLIVDDVDDLYLGSAQVQISGNLQDGDELRLTSTTNLLVSSYNTSLGNLAITNSSLGTWDDAQHQFVQLEFRHQGHQPNPDALAHIRALTWTIEDPHGLQATCTLPFEVIDINDVPTLTQLQGSQVGYPEGQGWMDMDPDLSVADLDHDVLQGAEVFLVDASVDDEFNFTTMSANLSLVMVSGNVQLSGNADVATYQQVLRSLQYQNLSANPTESSSNLTRQVQYRLNDGEDWSETQWIDLTLIPENDLPQVNLSITQVTLVEETTLLAFPNLSLSDLDDTQFDAATVTIVDDAQDGDVLSVTASSGVAGLDILLDTTSITITGDASLSDYASVLQTVALTIPGDNPDDYGAFPTRRLSLQVFDGASWSALASLNVDIEVINDAPTLSAFLPFSVGFTENGDASSLWPSLRVEDADHRQLSGANVTISSAISSDVLSGAVGTSGLSMVQNGTSLELSGLASLETYQDVLRQVRYASTSNNPTVYSTRETRSVSLTVFDELGASATEQITVTLGPENDRPEWVGLNSPLDFQENQNAILLASTSTVSDVDDLFLQAAVLSFSSEPQALDVLSANGLNTNLTANYDADQGQLTLSGCVSLADMQSVLRTIDYINTGENPTDGGDLTERDLLGMVYDGFSWSEPSTIQLSVYGENDAPILTGLADLSYTEQEGEISLFSDLSIFDDEDDVLVGARVRVHSPHDDDVLSLAESFKLLAEGEGSSTILLTGTASANIYASILQHIKYNNISDNPDLYGNDPSREIEVELYDGLSWVPSQNLTLSINPINDGPELVPERLEQVFYLSVGDQWNWSYLATDPDDLTLNASTGVLPSWLSLDDDAQRVWGTVDSSAAGSSFSISVSVTDDDGLSDETNFQVIINEEQPSVVGEASVVSTRILIVDVNGHPVPNAEVSLRGTERLITDADGFVTLRLPAGQEQDFQIGLSSANLRSQSFSAPLNLGELNTFTLQPQGEVRVYGRVFANGRALPLAAVKVYHSSHGTFEAFTNDEGDFEIFLDVATSIETWEIGVFRSGFDFELEAFQLFPGELEKEIDFSTFDLSQETLFGYEVHRAEDFEVSRRFMISIKAEPDFSNGDENSVLLDGLEAFSTSDLIYDEDRQVIKFDLTLPENFDASLIQFNLSATPQDGLAGSTEVFFSTEANAIGVEKTEAKVQQMVNRVLGGAGDLSSELILDDDGEAIKDRSGFEIPPFGVSSNVRFIKMERTGLRIEYYNESDFLGAVYSVDAYQVIEENGQSTVSLLESEQDIERIYLTFSFDPEQWDPYEDGIFYSSNKGRSWNAFPSSQIVYVDIDASLVTIESDHLSLWVLGEPGEGLIGNAGGGSSGGGCLMRGQDGSK